MLSWPKVPAHSLPSLKNDAPQPPANDTGDDDSIGGPGTPVSITFLGQHYQDGKLLAFAGAYQEAIGFHQVHRQGFN
jgi:Asp-tRNA(Asn)/Glu-tRNA(Gln) amidotransferase A subunit family amidase